MIKIIGTDPKLEKQITCHNCTSILRYAPNDVLLTGNKDEGVPIKGILCPACGTFLRTNP